MAPKAIILSGYGINCEYETKLACDIAGFSADIVHVNNLISNKSLLDEYQFLVFPGGFSYGDDTGSGNGLANKLTNNLDEELKKFTRRDNTFTLGVCNGFQVLICLGLLPFNDGKKHAALAFNNSARYECRWVELHRQKNCSPITNMGYLDLPIAHGEGRFFANDSTIKELKEKNQIVFTYRSCRNPNGSLEDIAGICSSDGKIVGMMPHPERAVFFTQRPDWLVVKENLKRSNMPIPEYSSGLELFIDICNFVK